jgi:hypothetical protein
MAVVNAQNVLNDLVERPAGVPMVLMEKLVEAFTAIPQLKDALKGYLQGIAALDPGIMDSVTATVKTKLDFAEFTESAKCENAFKFGAIQGQDNSRAGSDRLRKGNKNTIFQVKAQLDGKLGALLKSVSDELFKWGQSISADSTKSDKPAHASMTGMNHMILTLGFVACNGDCGIFTVGGDGVDYKPHPKIVFQTAMWQLFFCYMMGWRAGAYQGQAMAAVQIKIKGLSKVLFGPLFVGIDLDLLVSSGVVSMGSEEYKIICAHDHFLAALNPEVPVAGGPELRELYKKITVDAQNSPEARKMKVMVRQSLCVGGYHREKLEVSVKTVNDAIAAMAAASQA